MKIMRKAASILLAMALVIAYLPVAGYAADPHTLRVDVTGHGTVTAKQNGSNIPLGNIKVNGGEKITFTATPDEGYEVFAWVVPDIQGSAVSEIMVYGSTEYEYTVQDLGGTSSTYILVVTVIFQRTGESATAHKVTVTVATPGLGSVISEVKNEKSVTVGGSDSAEKITLTVDPGHNVFLTAIPKRLYTVDSWKVVNGVNPPKYPDKSEFDFKMPDKDVEVEISFKEDDPKYYHNLTVVVAPTDKNPGTVWARVGGVEEETFTKGLVKEEEPNLVMLATAYYGWRFSHWVTPNRDDASQGNNPVYANSEKTNVLKWPMTKFDATVKAVFIKLAEYDVDVSIPDAFRNDEKYKDIILVTHDEWEEGPGRKIKAVEGTTVKVTVTPPEGMIVDPDLSARYTEKTGKIDETTGKYTYKTVYLKDEDGTMSFKMPADGVFVTCNFIEDDGSTSPSITKFTIGGVKGVIDETATPKTITLTLPHGTDLKRLEPEIEYNDYVDRENSPPAGGVTVDFTKEVDYVLTGKNGDTKTYTVKVTIGEQPLTDRLWERLRSGDTTANNGTPWWEAGDAGSGQPSYWDEDGGVTAGTNSYPSYW